MGTTGGKKKIVKLIAVIVSISIVIAIAMGDILIRNSTDSMRTEINSEMVGICEKNANDMDGELNHMVGLADALLAYVENEFEYSEYLKSPDEYVDHIIEDASDYMEKCLNTSENAHSLYVVFDSSLTSEPKEAWVALRDGQIKRIFKNVKNSSPGIGANSDQDKAYYHNAVRSKDGVWTGLYFDNDIKENVFSYTRAVYVDDHMIGVIGADIVADDILGLLNKMKISEKGCAILMDADYRLISSSEQDADEMNREVISTLKKEMEDRGSQEDVIDSKICGEDMTLSCARLDNDWILAMASQSDVVYASINRIRNVIVISGLLLAVLVMIAMGIYTAPFLKKETELERSNEQKDIMIAYQSRQAKIGEMIGNISHQWKQPLHSINLISEDILDAYRFDELDENKLEEDVSRIETITEKMSETITDFSAFLKPNSGETEFFNIMQCVQSSLNLLESNLKHNQIDVRLKQQDLAWVYGNSNEMIHVIFNVLHNARDAILSSAKAEKVIDIKVSADDRFTSVRIADSGDGIQQKSLQHIFDPYYSTKGDGGTGLGLYISKRIVEERMDGEITMENGSPEEYDFSVGAVCTIKVPKQLQLRKQEG